MRKKEADFECNACKFFMAIVMQSYIERSSDEERHLYVYTSTYIHV